MGNYSYKDETSPEYSKINVNQSIGLSETRQDTNEKFIPQEKTRPISDDQAIMRQSLKVLYKNNFVALTFEDLHAFIIQVYYRQHLINRLKNKRRGIIDIIYTPFGLTLNTKSKTDSIFLCCDIKKYPYRSYDLTVYKNLIKIVDKLGGKDNLPLVFINGYYIGGKDKFQEFEDLNILSHLLGKQYERRCLSCDIIRVSKDSNDCSYCLKSFLNFAVSSTKYDIYGNRWHDIQKSPRLKT